MSTEVKTLVNSRIDTRHFDDAVRNPEQPIHTELLQGFLSHFSNLINRVCEGTITKGDIDAAIVHANHVLRFIGDGGLSVIEGLRSTSVSAIAKFPRKWAALFGLLGFLTGCGNGSGLSNHRNSQDLTKAFGSNPDLNVADCEVMVPFDVNTLGFNFEYLKSFKKFEGGYLVVGDTPGGNTGNKVFLSPGVDFSELNKVLEPEISQVKDAIILFDNFLVTSEVNQATTQYQLNFYFLNQNKDGVEESKLTWSTDKTYGMDHMQLDQDNGRILFIGGASNRLYTIDLPSETDLENRFLQMEDGDAPDPLDFEPTEIKVKFNGQELTQLRDVTILGDGVYGFSFKKGGSATPSGLTFGDMDERIFMATMKGGDMEIYNVPLLEGFGEDISEVSDGHGTYEALLGHYINTYVTNEGGMQCTVIEEVTTTSTTTTTTSTTTSQPTTTTTFTTTSSTTTIKPTTTTIVTTTTTTSIDTTTGQTTTSTTTVTEDQPTTTTVTSTTGEGSTSTTQPPETTDDDDDDDEEEPPVDNDDDGANPDQDPQPSADSDDGGGSSGCG